MMRNTLKAQLVETLAQLIPDYEWYKICKYANHEKMLVALTYPIDTGSLMEKLGFTIELYDMQTKSPLENIRWLYSSSVFVDENSEYMIQHGDLPPSFDMKEDEIGDIANQHRWLDQFSYEGFRLPYEPEALGDYMVMEHSKKRKANTIKMRVTKKTKEALKAVMHELKETYGAIYDELQDQMQRFASRELEEIPALEAMPSTPPPNQQALPEQMWRWDGPGDDAGEQALDQ